MLPTDNLVRTESVSLLQLAHACADYLRLQLPSTGKHPGHVRDNCWRAWEAAVKEDNDFLYTQDSDAVYESCKEKDVNELTMEQVRACIASLLHGMEGHEAPYPCIEDGILLKYLDQWMNMMEGTNG